MDTAEKGAVCLEKGIPDHRKALESASSVCDADDHRQFVSAVLYHGGLYRGGAFCQRECAGGGRGVLRPDDSVHFDSHRRRRGSIGDHEPLFWRERLPEDEAVHPHGVDSLSRDKPCAGRHRAFAWKADHDGTQHACRRAGGRHGLSEYLFSGTSVSVYV